jgi:hypothetical protein
MDLLLLENDITKILKDHKMLKKLQSLHEANFSIREHWTTSLENVPATAKQILPPFFPPFIPLKNSSAAARQIPSSATFSPSGSLPHFICSQQFCFFETNSIIPIYLEIRGKESYAHLASKNSQQMVATLEIFYIDLV